jgi:Tfp pilus assembly protein FimV
MAIAPLPDHEYLDALTATRPPLRLLPSPGDGSRAADPVVILRARPTRPLSPARRARIRRNAVLVALAGLLVALALPLSSLGGTSGARPDPVVAGSTYAVRPGDTLWSIAERLHPGDNPTALVQQMAAQTGSSTVVVGEHIVLP